MTYSLVKYYKQKRAPLNISIYLFLEFAVFGRQLLHLLLHLVQFLLLLQAALQCTLAVLQQTPLPLREVCALLDLPLYFKQLCVCG